MSNWKQRLIGAYMVVLIAVAVAVAVICALLPASDLGERFLHALFGILAVGVLGVVSLLVAMFVLAAKEATSQRRAVGPSKR